MSLCMASVMARLEGTVADLKPSGLCLRHGYAAAIAPHHIELIVCNTRTKMLHTTRPSTQFRGPRDHARPTIKAPVATRGAVRMSAVQLPPMPSGTAPVSDASVPEGHKGLHASLYGDGGAEEHDAVASYTARQSEDDGSQVVNLLQWLEDRDGEKPLGVYAIYDDQSQVQYIGYSRNMVIAVRGHHTRVGASRASQVRAMVFNNKAMATRDHLEREVASWVTRYAGGVVPVGNAAEKDLWDGAKAMSEAEAQAYAEKAAKLKRAMGEGTGQGAKAAEAAATPEQTRQALRQAVEGKGDWSAEVDGVASASNWQTTVDTGDWSQEINRQTQETVASPSSTSPNGSSAPSAGSSASGPIVSPFAQPSVHRAIGEGQRGAGGGGGAAGNGGGPGASSAKEEKPMTVENVDQVLNEVRPYLIADGGDVEVVQVEDGRIYLRLQGSCSTCASSAATMKMGIERALQAAFGDVLKEVVQVDKVDVVAPTVANINLHLDMLRGAINSFGGKVEAVEVSGAKAVIKYKGPPAIGKGVTAAIRDRFPAIREVVVQDY